MDTENNKSQVKKIEEAISYIGAKVADAAELSQQAKRLSGNSEALLINVQQELEDLYVSLDKASEEAK